MRQPKRGRAPADLGDYVPTQGDRQLFRVLGRRQAPALRVRGAIELRSASDQ